MKESKLKRIPRTMAMKSAIIGAAFAIFALIIIGRLVYLQIIEYDSYHAQVMNEITYEQEVNPERGTIYDTSGNILAGNRKVYLCFISPEDIINCEEKFTWTDKNGMTHKEVSANEIIAGYLSETLGVDYSEILEKAAKEGRYYEKILERIDETTAEPIKEFLEEHELTHMVYLQSGTERYYPSSTLASHTIGFLNSDGTGRSGLEQYYNNILEGTSGKYVSAKDAKSNEMDYKYTTTVEAEDGYNIYTTIDTYIQYQLEQVIKATLEENQAANRVAGIVMNVKTGAILGMATAPSFDLNSPYTLDSYSENKLAEYTSSEDREKDAYSLAEKSYLKENPDTDKEAEGYDFLIEAYFKENHDTYYEAAYTEYYHELLYIMWKNKTISELYEPGSTSKILTIAMAIEEDASAVTDTYFCGGSYKLENYASPIGCWEPSGHGTVTMARGLQQSCNPTLMQVALKIGRETFYDYFQRFGYTSITGVDLPSESYSLYHNYENFSTVSLAVYAFGQTYKTTMIQQITALSSIANGGYLVTPHLLKEVTDSDGNVIMTYDTDVKRQVISTEVCETVTGILADGVATDGAARNAKVPGYSVAAKTGTSEKIDEKDETGQTYLRVGSCVAYGPADDPEIIALIVTDEPMGGSVYGSVVAAPYVSELLSNIFPYLGYEASEIIDSSEVETTTVVDYVEWDVSIAKSAVTNNGMTAVVAGGGDTVTGQIPPAGSTIAKSGAKIVLLTNGVSETNKVKVPDLVGKTAEQARRALNDVGLNIRYTGSTSNSEAVVIAQTFAEGSELYTGEVIEVTMRVTSGSADG